MTITAAIVPSCQSAGLESRPGLHEAVGPSGRGGALLSKVNIRSVAEFLGPVARRLEQLVRGLVAAWS